PRTAPPTSPPLSRRPRSPRRADRRRTESRALATRPGRARPRARVRPRRPARGSVRRRPRRGRARASRAGFPRPGRARRRKRDYGVSGDRAAAPLLRRGLPRRKAAIVVIAAILRLRDEVVGLRERLDRVLRRFELGLRDENAHRVLLRRLL